MSQGRKNQNHVLEYFLHMSGLVLDCYWFGFDKIQDRFELDRGLTKHSQNRLD